MSTLKITGEVEKPLALGPEDLAAFAEEEKVADVARLGSSRSGAGVWLRALLARAGARPGAKYVTFVSPSDSFSASAPLERLAAKGVVIHAEGGRPLPREKGGPFRFIIPDPAACGTDEIDECTNVKFLEEIILSQTRGRDTRPANERDHHALHEAQGGISSGG